jgi:tetratricopeptide (TPR) repeat protein
VRQALDERKRLVADFPDVPDFRHGLARSYINLATLWLMHGNPRRAERPFCEALSLLEQLVAECPGVPLYRFDLAKCHNNWAVYFDMTDRPAESEQPFRDALACYQQLVTAVPGELLYQEQLALAHYNLGVFFARGDKGAEAVDTLGRACFLYEKLIEAHPEVPEFRHRLATAYLQLAQQRRRRNARGEAEEADRKALHLLERLVEAFPRSPEYLHDLAWHLATCYEVLHRNPARAVELARRLTTLFPQSSEGWAVLGVACCRTENWNDAVAALQRSQELRRGGNSASARGYFLAMAYWRLGDEARARLLFKGAVDRQKKNDPYDEELLRFRAEVEPLLAGDAAGGRSEKRGLTPEK